MSASARASTLLLLLLGVGCAPPSVEPATDSSPNILFVLLDDVRFDDFGFTGHPFVKTPNFDRVADEGLSFTDYYAEQSCTAVARPSSRARSRSAPG